MHKGHDIAKETPFPPFPLYVAIKIYSVSRSKTLINWLYFCAGISISYDRLLDVTRDMAMRSLSQYKRDGVFLPKNLLKNIFTIFAKDNIDNSRSSTASKHYHGTSLSIFQFPTLEIPGELIEQISPFPASDSDNLSSTSKKIETTLPESFTLIKRFLSTTTTIHNTKRLLHPVLPKLDEKVHEKGTNEEIEWLKQHHHGLHGWNIMQPKKGQKFDQWTLQPFCL